jgi:hypothetical protein
MSVYISVRVFTPDAHHFAKTAPAQLIDSEQLVFAIGRIRDKMNNQSGR